jgi:uncharacterized membrane protein YbhN (UPF0104 family)
VNATTAVSQPLLGVGPRRPRWLLRAVHLTIGIAVAATLVVVVVPRLLGTTMSSVGVALGRASLPDVVGLVVLWMAGLVVHSFVLTGALPGLGRGRALTLNLTGSAVANVLPFGGPVGVSLNYLMLRAWGFGPDEFASYAVVTTTYSLVTRLVMPAVGLLALTLSGRATSSLRWPALVGGVVLVLLLAGVGGALASRAWADRAARRAAGLVGRLRRRSDPDELVRAMLCCRDAATSALRHSWLQMSTAMAGYAALQAVLLGACLVTTGGHPAVVTVLVGYAVDRAFTFAVVSPGGAGLNEAAMAAVLIALGGSPAATVAGVLLYRGLTFALEIPVGGLWLGGWLIGRRRARDPRPQAA